MAPETLDILEMVYASNEPVSMEAIIATIGPLVHPSVAHRLYVHDIEQSRANGHNLRQYADTNDHEHTIRLGRRRVVMSRIANLVNTGRLERDNSDGQKRVKMGPKPLLLPVVHTYIVEWPDDNPTHSYVTDMTPEQAEQLASEDEHLRVQRVATLSLWDLRQHLALTEEQEPILTQ